MKGPFLNAGRRVALALGASVALAVLGASAAHAEYVPCETPFLSSAPPLESLVDGAAGSAINTTRVVWGAGLSVSALTTSGAGTVSFSLIDRQMFGTALSALELFVTDLNNRWESYKVTGNGIFDVDVTGPTKLFAAVFAQSVDGRYGLYTLNANFAPVPLPAAVWLLGSALAGGLAFFRRKP